MLAKLFGFVEHCFPLLRFLIQLVMTIRRHFAGAYNIGSDSPSRNAGAVQTLQTAESASVGHFGEWEVARRAKVASLQHTPLVDHLVQRNAHQQFEGVGQLSLVGIHKVGNLARLACARVVQRPYGGVDYHFARRLVALVVECFDGGEWFDFGRHTSFV